MSEINLHAKVLLVESGCKGKTSFFMQYFHFANSLNIAEAELAKVKTTEVLYSFKLGRFLVSSELDEL